MKYLLVILSIVLLSGCGKFERAVASVSGGGYITCVDGVEYVQFTSGATVKYKKDGTISTCKEN